MHDPKVKVIVTRLNLCLLQSEILKCPQCCGENGDAQVLGRHEQPCCFRKNKELGEMRTLPTAGKARVHLAVEKNFPYSFFFVSTKGCQ